MKKDPFLLIPKIVKKIFDKKGSQIIALDVRGISSLTDYILIANGNVARHVIALAKEVEDLLRKEGETPLCVEGMQYGDWVVLDYLELIIHLFIPDMRQKYRLERLWSDGKIIDIGEL